MTKSIDRDKNGQLYSVLIFHKAFLVNGTVKKSYKKAL